LHGERLSAMMPRMRTFRFLETVVFALALGGAGARAGGPLAVGDPAPDVTLLLDDGTTFRLASAAKPVVLYFYPKDDTPGCTREACAFRDRMGEFEKAGALVIGISFDGAPEHKQFREKYHFRFPLATDDGSIARAFGVEVRGVGGARFHARDTVVIGADRKVRALLRGVDPEQSLDQVLAAIRT
jgi:peroxiredoxin Q/BCP